MSGLFEHLAAQDDSALVANRKATAVANKRVKDRFGAFLANARGDLEARLALVEEDIVEVVNDVVGEYGGDAEKISAAIKQSMMPPEVSTPPVPSATAPGGQNPNTQAAQGTCPKCGGPLVNGTCPMCQGQNHSPAMGVMGYNPAGPLPSPSTGPMTASVKEARRPKMCPYHSEVTDIALGTGDPQAGFNAMSSHAWGDRHCKGAYEGTCNFRPAMVTQKFWDDKQQEYDDRRDQREREQVLAPPAPELSIDTEPIMEAEPFEPEQSDEGVNDIDGELENAPSAVGAGEMAMSAKTAEALETEKLPKGGESALGGPSPKIDKGRSGDQGGWSLEPIDTQMDGSPNPSIEQDPTDKADYNKKDFLDQTKGQSETQDLPTGKGLDGGGFNTKRNITQSPTKTWSGESGQHDPVTRESLSSRQSKDWIDKAVKHPGALHEELDVPKGEKIPEDKLEEAEHSDNPKERERANLAETFKGMNKKKGTQDVDKNPIAEILEEFGGHLMPQQVESALRDWNG